MAKEKEKRPRNWRTFCKEVSKLLGEDEVVSSNETATTSIENIKDLLPKNKGIVLGSDENKPFIDKKKVKNIYEEMILPLIDKGVLEITRYTNKSYSSFDKNFIFKNRILIKREYTIILY